MEASTERGAFARAADAVLNGQAAPSDWLALVELSADIGIENVVTALMQHAGLASPALQWWPCNILLASDLSRTEEDQFCQMLSTLEEHGAGPRFDLDRHALEVSAAVRFLQDHLQRLCAGQTPPTERASVMQIVRLLRRADLMRPSRHVVSRLVFHGPL